MYTQLTTSTSIIFKHSAVSYRLRQLLPELPSISFDYGTSPYNASKVALLIENRPLGLLAPLLLHMVAVLPPDWRFLFLGSDASIGIVDNSAAIRRQVAIGKLELKLLPSNVSIGGQEDISRFFTELWVYQHLFWPAEWLLVYQTDSVMCASNKGTVDDWLEYDWVGAPWSGDSRYGGNGGLSLRRVSSIITVLENQRRQEFSEPEDVWLTERLGHLPNSRVANGSESVKFSGESIWYEEPLGYHTGGGGNILSGGIWGAQERRQHIWNYCPEMKMTLDMDAASFMPERCLENW